MNRFVAALLLARIADGIRLSMSIRVKKNRDNISSLDKQLERTATLLGAIQVENRKQGNRSDSRVEHVGVDGTLERNATLLGAIQVENRKQGNRSDSRVEHLGVDGTLLEAREAERQNKTAIDDAPLQQAIAPHTIPDPWPRRIGTLAAIIATVSAFILICCFWCLRPELQSDPHVATRRSIDRRNTTIGAMICHQRTSVYLTYWELDGNDPKRPWNPTEQGGKDGVQLAIVKDGEVRRIPTDGICTQNSGAMHKSKEWHHLNMNAIPVVDYMFDAMPSASTANQYRDKYGEKDLDLRRTFWGKRTLAVDSIYEAFHRRARHSINW